MHRSAVTSKVGEAFCSCSPFWLIEGYPERGNPSVRYAFIGIYKGVVLIRQYLILNDKDGWFYQSSFQLGYIIKV